jgi:hypothetical protein
MRVMVLVKATADSEKGFALTPETKKMLEAMGKFNDELRKAGILRDADGLKPSSHGKRVAFDGSNRKSRRASSPIPANWSPASLCGSQRTWTRRLPERCPNPMPEPSEVEIRPLAEMDDLR